MTMTSNDNENRQDFIKPTSCVFTGKNQHLRNTYIVKPNLGSQGDGIFLVHDPRDVQEVLGNRSAVVQVKIEDFIFFNFPVN